MILLIVVVAIVLFAMGGAGAQDRDGSKDDYGYEDFSDGERYDYDYDELMNVAETNTTIRAAAFLSAFRTELATRPTWSF